MYSTQKPDSAENVPTLDIVWYLEAMEFASDSHVVGGRRTVRSHREVSRGLTSPSPVCTSVNHDYLFRRLKAFPSFQMVRKGPSKCHEVDKYQDEHCSSSPSPDTYNRKNKVPSYAHTGILEVEEKTTIHSQ